MPLKKYEKSEQINIETLNILNEYNDDSTSISKSIFSAIGNFWTQYYTDIDVLNSLFSGVTNLMSQKYLDLLNLVLSSNVINIPISNPYRTKIIVFSSADKVTNYLPGETEPDSIEFTMTNLNDMSALVNSLFEPDVVLEKDVHFTISGNKIKFYVDIFNDPEIISEAYKVELNNVDYILFLAVDLVLDEYSIYERFGSFLYKKLPNTLTYKLLNIALQIFYTSNTNVDMIETTLNILLGLPFCTKTNEVIENIVDTINGVVTLSDVPILNRFISINGTYIYFREHRTTQFEIELADNVSDQIQNIATCINEDFTDVRVSFTSATELGLTADYNLDLESHDSHIIVSTDKYVTIYTNKSTYTSPFWAEILVTEGQELTIGTLLSRWTVVADLISNDEWYNNSRFPFELITRFSKPVRRRRDYSMHYYNGIFRHNGLITYQNYTPALITDPVEALAYAKEWFKSRKNSPDEFEQWLYDQYNGYLKYNTYSIKTALTEENYTNYRDVRSAFLDINKGTPSYLYPIVDTVFSPIITEEVFTFEETAFTIFFQPFIDWVEYVYPNFQFFYDGTYNYDGSQNYVTTSTFRRLHFDDTVLTLQLDFAMEDRCNISHYDAGSFKYDGVYYYDGSQQYSLMNSVDDAFSFIIITR